ncbi:MAG TPA: hypothetical protein VLJ42_07315 [Solirubrobacteraceae bacterium]|nr:hypothetical protein [Solirubrobacteraceae bacterium]
MHSRLLESSLRSFVEEAALALQAELDAGAEVPFELATQSSRGSRTPLYSYRPLTATFIRERTAMLPGLSSHADAASQLESFAGLERYLLSRSVQAVPSDSRVRVRTGLRVLLEDVFEDQTDFELRAERLQQALSRLDGSAQAGGNEITLVATLHGLTIAAAELPLTKGLKVARPDAISGIPQDVVAPDCDRQTGHLLVLLTIEGEDAHAKIADGRAVLLDLLRALRLFGDGRVTLGALAWARVGAGAWTPLALASGGRPYGMLVVSAEQEDELRAFCNLVSRRAPDDGELAWALERFEMGCERASEYEALSDNLLALRALLEPEGASSGLLAERLAALCAASDARAELSERIMRAQALEQAYIAGTVVEHHGDHALMRELAEHLQALLRDVVCGHLDPDLIVLADELLTHAPELALTAHEPVAGLEDEPVAGLEHQPVAGLEHEPSASTRQALAARQLAQQVFGDLGEAGEVLHVSV